MAGAGESPRFFEAMVIGRHYTEVAPIVSRICGICSISHTFSSLRATEEAIGITISEETEALRRHPALGRNPAEPYAAYRLPRRAGFLQSQ